MADVSNIEELKAANLESAAQGMVIKQRNLILEGRNTENQTKIQGLKGEVNELKEHFNGYQKQTKEEKEKADAKNIELEQTVAKLENQLEETTESYEKKIREIEAEHNDRYKQLTDKLYLIEAKEEAADKFLQDKETML